MMKGDYLLLFLFEMVYFDLANWISEEFVELDMEGGSDSQLEKSPARILPGKQAKRRLPSELNINMHDLL